MAPLIVTMGEPAGIGPDITARAWHALRADGPAFCLIADPDWFATRARDVPVAVIASPAETAHHFADRLPVLPLRLRNPSAPGRLDPANAPAVTEAIRRAVDLALAGEVSGLVTNPVQKETLYEAGFTHPGHTEYLASLATEAGHAAEPVMMLAAPGLRTVPVTIHIALADVPGKLTTGLILRTARITAADLTRSFGIARPRLAIAGLNPHAGENGTMGHEDQEIIAPAIATLRAEGIDARGPLPADTLFHAEARATYDVVLCMYHDQALIPVKTLDFHGGVNITLGLPFVRTSPDHGTALSLAGTGKANPASLLAAIHTAHEMAARR